MSKAKRALPILIILAALAAPARSEPRDEAGLAAFLDDLDARLEAIDTARQLEFYYQLKGLPAPNLQRYQDLHRELFSDREKAAVLDRWRERVADPVLKRRVDLYRDVYLDFMYDTFRLAAVDPALVSSFTALQVSLNEEITAFKPLYQGERAGRAAVVDALRFEPDRDKRREAYLAGAELSERLAPRMREFLRATRDMHRAMGFSGTVEARLRGGGLSREKVEALFSELEARTREPYLEMLKLARRDLGLERVEPWDLRFWVEKQAGAPPEAFSRDKAADRLLETARGLGFEPEKLAISVENANMSNGGWNIPIRMGAEARLVLNPFAGRAYYDALFHEYGHALHEVLIRQPVGTFRTDRPGVFAEGMAEVMAEFVNDPLWQAKTLGLGGRAITAARQAERWRRLLSLRQLLFRNAFEYAAFDEPDQDLELKYRELMERILLVSAPEKPAWADDMFLVQPQVYVQNYVLASMVSAQVHRAMRLSLGPALYPNPKVAEFLSEKFYRHGASRDWEELLKEATGAELGADAYLGSLSL